MGRKKLNIETSIVQIREIDNKKGVRFYLRYTLRGERVEEMLKEIPFSKRTDKQAYREARQRAEAVCAERTKEIRNNELGFNTTRSKILLSDWLEQCATRREQNPTAARDRHTYVYDVRHLKELIIEFCEDVRLHDIDKDFVKRFIHFLRFEHKTPSGECYAPKTADLYFRVLKTALNDAMREEIINYNPCGQLAANEKIKVPESTREYLTLEELQTMIATPTESGVRNIFLFMCCCGLRISDAKGLRWADIEADGHGSKVARIVQQKTQEPIYLPLSEQACKFLPERGEKSENAPVFDVPTEQVMNRALKHWAKAAGINKTVTLHVARHTFATLMLTNGADIYTTSKLLGHNNVSTTQIYAKIVDEKKRNAVETIKF